MYYTFRTTANSEHISARHRICRLIQRRDYHRHPDHISGFGRRLRGCPVGGHRRHHLHPLQRGAAQQDEQRVNGALPRNQRETGRGGTQFSYLAVLQAVTLSSIYSNFLSFKKTYEFSKIAGFLKKYHVNINIRYMCMLII